MHNSANNGARRKGQFIMPAPVKPVEDDGVKTIILPEVLTIKELADKLKMPAAALVKKLFLQGKVVTINQEITFEEAEEIALEFEVHRLTSFTQVIQMLSSFLTHVSLGFYEAFKGTLHQKISSRFSPETTKCS